MTRNDLAAKALALITGTAMLGACATLEEGAAEAVAETYNATLTGAQVVGTGDQDGTATAELTITDELNGVCYDISNVRGLANVTGAHIHRGAAGTNGPPILTLTRAEEGAFTNCVSRSEWTEDFLENDPTGFYFQIHTAEYPNGAIRGQIRRN